MKIRSSKLSLTLSIFIAVTSCMVTLDKLEDTSTCIPNCYDRLCGENGCGGSCGSCNASQKCSSQGKCVSIACVGNCTNKECGDDGCGNECGKCNPGHSCSMQGNCFKPAAGLYTKENHILRTRDDSLFRGRGANIFDTRSCNACTTEAPDVNEVKRRIDELVDNWKANFIRLSLQSFSSQVFVYNNNKVTLNDNNWKSVLNDDKYLADIREIVKHIGMKPDVYVLVSLWYEPSVDENHIPIIDSEKGTDAVWRKLVHKLCDQPHALFGITNEPRNTEDSVVWNKMNEVVKAIRKAESEAGCLKHVIAVQGTQQYARLLKYYVEHPITAGNGENIVYETHAYGPESRFNELFIEPAKKLPVIIGEFGPYDHRSYGGDNMTLDDCKKMIIKAEESNVSYLAWSFHMRCPENLLKDYSNGKCGINMKLEPTEWGQILKDRLNKPWGTQ